MKVIAKMNEPGRPPLPTLLSQTLVAFIIEFDNEFQRLPGNVGVSVRNLPRLAGCRRWRSPPRSATWQTATYGREAGCAPHGKGRASASGLPPAAAGNRRSTGIGIRRQRDAVARCARTDCSAHVAGAIRGWLARVGPAAGDAAALSDGPPPGRVPGWQLGARGYSGKVKHCRPVW